MAQDRVVGVEVVPPEERAASGTVGAYVVTYKRPRLLAETLRAVLAQTHPLQTVAVMNNDAGTDVRRALAEEFPGVAVADIHRNAGSAGGFAAALRLAYDAGLDWAWLLDDDVLPWPDALARLLAAYPAAHRQSDPVGILAPLQASPRSVFGVSLWRHRLVPPPASWHRAGRPYPVDVAYWAGMLLHRRVVERIGFPRSDFFRCFGDYEYCLRARTAGLRIIAVPASRVSHTPGDPVVVERFGRRSLRFNYSPARNYYHVRNAAFTMRFVLRDPLALGLHTLRQVRLALGDLLYEAQKAERLRLRLRGLRDGFAGRLGRREDLE